MLLSTLKSLFARPTEQDEPITAKVLRLLREKQPEQAKMALLQVTEGKPPEPEMLALLGEVQYHLNDPAEAERLFLQALNASPGLAQGHYGLSLLYYDSQRFEDALAQAQYARNLAPGKARFLAQLGLCHIALHEFGPARDTLRQAVLLDPENVPALNNYAIALHAIGDHADAWYYLNRALALSPDYAPAQDNLHRLFGVSACETNFHPEAATLESKLMATGSPASAALENDEAGVLRQWEDEFAQDPCDDDLAVRLSRRYLRSLQLNEAADVLNIAIAHNPESTGLLLVAAELADSMGQYKRARKLYETILAHAPDNVDALLGLGVVLRQQGNVEDALAPVERAAELQASPNTLLQLVFAQCTACRYEECLSNCDRVETMAPELKPFLHASRAVSHAYLGHFKESFQEIAQAQEREVTNTGFQVFRGMLHLMHEHYREGWQGYSYRFFLNTTMKRLLPFPVWQGEPLAGKTILILAEQGLGDQIMFASCLPDLLEFQPAHVLLEANERSHATLARSFPQIQVIPSKQQSRYEWLGQDIKPDFYIPLADLPRLFRNEIADFPEHRGYLVAAPARVDYWRQRLREESALPKIGITWRGGAQITRQKVRTLSLEQLAPLLSDARLQFVCLQYGDVSAELEEFSQRHGLSILHFPEAVADLDDFAALIDALDLVITVCNTTVHYTGALGRECWVMTPHIPEWRYGLTSPGMRWYPSVKMFRQPGPGDWQSVIAAVTAAINPWLHAHTGTGTKLADNDRPSWTAGSSETSPGVQQ